MHLALRTSLPALQQRTPVRRTVAGNKYRTEYTCQASRRALLGGVTGTVIGGLLQDQAAAGASVLAPVRNAVFKSAAGGDGGDILTAQWFNAVCGAFNAPKKTSQVYQPTVFLGTTNVQLFTFLNSLPKPVAVAGDSDGASVEAYKQFYNQYRGMVESLRPKNKTALAAFEAALGDKQDDWETYNTPASYAQWKQANPNGNRQLFFDDWASFNLSNPGEAKRAYKAVANDPVNRALDALDPDVSPQNFVKDKQGSTYPKFTPVYEEVRTRVSGATKVSLNFDSSTESKDISDTFAQGSVGVQWRFFSGEADAKYSDLVKKISHNRITVQGSFEKGTSIAPEGITPGAWYDDGMITYAVNDDTAWQNRDDKAAYFGTKGSLRWVNQDVYVVFGNFDFDITYHTKLDTDEKKVIDTQTKAGVWPFFTFNASGGVSTEVKNVDSDTFTLKVTGTLPGAAVIATSFTNLA